MLLAPTAAVLARVDLGDPSRRSHSSRTSRIRCVWSEMMDFCQKKIPGFLPEIIPAASQQEIREMGRIRWFPDQKRNQAAKTTTNLGAYHQQQWQYIGDKIHWVSSQNLPATRSKTFSLPKSSLKNALQFTWPLTENAYINPQISDRPPTPKVTSKKSSLHPPSWGQNFFPPNSCKVRLRHQL